MTVQYQLAPYLNRFDLLLKQNEKASLKITYNLGKVVVNLKNELIKTMKADILLTSNENLEKMSKFAKQLIQQIAKKGNCKSWRSKTKITGAAQN